MIKEIIMVCWGDLWMNQELCLFNKACWYKVIQLDNWILSLQLNFFSDVKWNSHLAISPKAVPEGNRRNSHLAISPKAVPEGNQRFRLFRGQNQQPSSLGSSPALLARVRRASTNTGCFNQWLLAAIDWLEENMLPLLLYWLSSRVNKV